jgi:hypothetical protein
MRFWWMTLLLPLVAGCTEKRDLTLVGSIRVTINTVNGAVPPSADAPLPPNLGTVNELWVFDAEAIDAQGKFDPSFNGFTRVSAVPGDVNLVEGAGSNGRNIQFVDGRATGTAYVTRVCGPSRLWFSDIGYEPTTPGELPGCNNGTDDDGDVTGDFPNDPGCAFSDDNNEEEGTLRTGVSPEIAYAKCTLADVNGRGTATPFPAVAVDVATKLQHVFVDPMVVDQDSFLIVTRVSQNGFFVTDINDPIGGYNHVFAFNFNTPAGLRVCNRLGLFTGTAAEFFGFTEIAFPSYEVGRVDANNTTVCERDINCDAAMDPLCCPSGQICERLDEFDLQGICQPCLMPEPRLIDNTEYADDVVMETLESGLVSIDQVSISAFIGAGTPEPDQGGNYQFTADASNCDLDGDGEVEFFELDEGACSSQCGANPNCTDWLSFVSFGGYKVRKGSGQGAATILLNTSTAGFNPVPHRGEELTLVVGTLRHFSGGPNNWTIETRCPDDMNCSLLNAEGEPECNYVADVTRACVDPATIDDNDAGTN